MVVSVKRGRSDPDRGRPGHRRLSPLLGVLALVAFGVALLAGGSPASALDGPGSSPADLEIPGADEATVDSITRLYLATLGRLPDPDGHRYWVGRWQAGVDPADIAASFMASPEWATRVGDADDTRFVELLYANVLGRAPDAEGGAYWRALLGQGAPRVELVLQFAQSEEHVRRTGTVPPAPAYPPVPIGAGQGRRIVYDNTAQRVWLIEADESVRDSYLVSGRRDTPDPGVYAVYSKSEKAWAGHGGITMDHMVRFARGRRLAIGFHSIPVRSNGDPLQTLDQLGTHQSAGCVRQSPIKAELLYQWADIGTTVVVLP